MYIELHWWHLYVPYISFIFCLLVSGHKEREKLLDKACVTVSTFWKKPSHSVKEWRWYFMLALGITYGLVFWALGVGLLFVLLGEIIELCADIAKDRWRKRLIVPTAKPASPAAATAAPALPRPSARPAPAPTRPSAPAPAQPSAAPPPATP